MHLASHACPSPPNLCTHAPRCACRLRPPHACSPLPLRMHAPPSTCMHPFMSYLLILWGSWPPENWGHKCDGGVRTQPPMSAAMLFLNTPTMQSLALSCLLPLALKAMCPSYSIHECSIVVFHQHSPCALPAMHACMLCLPARSASCHAGGGGQAWVPAVLLTPACMHTPSKLSSCACMYPLCPLMLPASHACPLPLMHACLHPHHCMQAPTPRCTCIMHACLGFYPHTSPHYALRSELPICSLLHCEGHGLQGFRV